MIKRSDDQLHKTNIRPSTDKDPQIERPFSFHHHFSSYGVLSSEPLNPDIRYACVTVYCTRFRLGLQDLRFLLSESPSRTLNADASKKGAGTTELSILETYSPEYKMDHPDAISFDSNPYLRHEAQIWELDCLAEQEIRAQQIQEDFGLECDVGRLVDENDYHVRRIFFWCFFPNTQDDKMTRLGVVQCGICIRKLYASPKIRPK